MSLAHFIAIGAIGVILYFVSRILYRLFLLRNYVTSVIRGAATGQVELDGVARNFSDKHKLRAPLSGRECVWYRVRYYERDIPIFSKHEDHSSTELFIIQDETGKSVIDPEQAEVVCCHKTRYSKGSAHSIGLHEDQTAIEEIIVEGDSLHVFGYFEDVNENKEDNFKQDYLATLRAWKNDPIKLRELDTDNNNHLDEVEWGEAVKAAKKEARDLRNERYQYQLPSMVKRCPNKHFPYIVSNKKKYQLKKHYYLILCANITLLLLITYYLTTL